LSCFRHEWSSRQVARMFKPIPESGAALYSIRAILGTVHSLEIELFAIN
jgi:hypothetical protein